MYRITLILTGVASAWLGVLLCIWAYHGLAAPGHTEKPNTPPSLDAIQELSALSVLKVEVTEAITTSFRGYTGGTTVVVLVNGTLTYGVDLDQARYLQTDQAQQHLVIGLPAPKTHDVAIHHDKSRVLSTDRSGLWQLAIGPAREDEALMSALATGRDRLIDTASRDELVSRARRQAEAVLARFISELGWTIEIQWEP